MADDENGAGNVSVGDGLLEDGIDGGEVDRGRVGGASRGRRTWAVGIGDGCASNGCRRKQAGKDDGDRKNRDEGPARIGVVKKDALTLHNGGGATQETPVTGCLE